MRAEHHPCGFDVRGQFSNACAFRGWMGGLAYKAERGGKPFIIIDEGTLADFLDEGDPSDRELLGRLVAILEFEDEAERQEYIAEALDVGVDLESRRRQPG